MKSTRRVAIGAGEIAITVHIDVLQLSRPERRLLNTMIDILDALEGVTANAADPLRDPDDGRTELTAN